MPSPAEVDRLRELLAVLAGHAVDAALNLFDSAEVEQILEAYPLLLEPYLDAAVEIAADWYASLAPDSGFPVEVAAPVEAKSLQGSVRWALTQTDVRAAVQGSTDRRVFDSARATITHNAVREKVYWSRGASASACPWCRVLATNGPIYHTAKAAVKGHDGCHCVPVPLRAGADYQPPDYVSDWEQQYMDARKQVGGNLDAIVNYLRRNDA